MPLDQMSSRVAAAIEALADRRPDLWSLSGVGASRSETVIQALLAGDAYARVGDRPRVLLVSGLSGRAEDVEVALRILEAWSNRREPPVALTAVPCLYPDGVSRGGAGSGEAAYPPQGGYYDDPDGPEERYLWRWTCLLAPDLVIEVRAGRLREVGGQRGGRHPRCRAGRCARPAAGWIRGRHRPWRAGGHRLGPRSQAHGRA